MNNHSKENVPFNDGKATVTVGPGDLKCLRVDSGF